MAYQKTEGTIEAVARTGKGFKIDDVWYSAFKAVQLKGAEKGDTVKFEFEEKNGFFNIKGDVKVVEKGEGVSDSGAAAPPASKPTAGGRSGGFTAKEFPMPATHPDRSIIRQNAANRAVELLSIAGVNAGTSDPSELAELAVELARTFEAYYAGEV